MTVDSSISQSEEASSKCLALIFLAFKDLYSIVGLIPQSLWILQKELMWPFAVKIIHVQLMPLQVSYLLCRQQFKGYSCD